MAQHKSCEPMTPEQRIAYGRKCAEFAQKMREEGDLRSAEMNERMAEIYAKPWVE
jgi:hypothetical protein